MNKKHQSKLEDIENEVDSFKKKRGRPVGSKTKKGMSVEDAYMKAVIEPIAKKMSKSLKEKIDWDAEWDNIEVPILKKITDDFTQPKQTLPPLPLTEKITRVLIVVVVAIFVTLLVKNI